MDENQLIQEKDKLQNVLNEQVKGHLLEALKLTNYAFNRCKEIGIAIDEVETKTGILVDVSCGIFRSHSEMKEVFQRVYSKIVSAAKQDKQQTAIPTYIG